MGHQKCHGNFSLSIHIYRLTLYLFSFCEHHLHRWIECFISVTYTQTVSHSLSKREVSEDKTYVVEQRVILEQLKWVWLIQFFIFLFFKFTVLYWFCRISKWIHHRYTCVPHPEPSSLLPPHTIPLGRPSAPAPSIQYRASNLDRWLISYMILNMFPCHSPKLSHPLPLPHSPKERLFYTSVSLFLSCIQGYCYHLSKFHIYALVFCIGVFLSGLLHCIIGLQFHPPH